MVRGTIAWFRLHRCGRDAAPQLTAYAHGAALARSADAVGRELALTEHGPNASAPRSDGFVTEGAGIAGSAR